ncbi:MAG TPA: MoxR family ATPase [Verrucomicrobiae bacterium]|nr:MoxR family ATPase [Verrucomicrobiae bacterium]
MPPSAPEPDPIDPAPAPGGRAGWPGAPGLADPDAVLQALLGADYVAGRELATSCYLALELERPLLVEGEAGVGKTELAKALARCLHAPLLRLQCYEGIDVSQALYEWNHPRQLLAIRQAELRSAGPIDLFTTEFLIRRPLLVALDPPDGRRPVLLIDELDRADDEFEAFLLELLSDWQVTIPELGTVRAERPPLVVCTSNRTRELHDALKRRCLFHWIELPDLATELRIVERRLPEVAPQLARAATRFVHQLRREDLYKAPGIAETLDWAAALVALGAVELDAPLVDATLGSLVKYQEDLQAVRAVGVATLLGRAGADD